MAEPIKVLLVEDSESDALLVIRELRKQGFEPTHLRVQDADAMRAALEAEGWDLILSDFHMPQFTGLDALGVMQAVGVDLPFIILSGTVGEDIAVGAMKSGAHDYLMKGNMKRLGEAVRREMEAAEVRRQRRQAFERLQHLNRVLRAIRNINQLIVREKDPADLIQQACDQLIENRGYQGAWIATGDYSPTPGAIAQAGFGEAFAPFREMLAQGAWPRCRAELLASGDDLAVLDPDTDCSDCPLSTHHHELSVVVPLRYAGAELGLLGVSFPRDMEVDEEERSLLLEVAEDIGFALHDIDAERRRGEAERLATETGRMARVGGWQVDVASRKLTWSQVTREIHEVDDAYQPEIEAALGFFDPEDRPVLERALEAAMRDGTPYDLELRFTSAKGNHLWTQTKGTPVVEDEKVVELRGTFQDITERKQLQAKLAQADRLSSMGMLAAGVAHEINNPLSYVLYNLESLVEDLPELLDAMRTFQARVSDHLGADKLDALVGAASESMNPAMLGDIRERFADALEGSRRIQNIARGLGTFSRVERDKLVPVNLMHVVEVAINMAYNEIKYRARLVKEYGKLPTVMASEGRLSQVFLNLLINAAHAIDEGNVEANEIRVRTWEQDGAVWAAVADTGKGIAPEHMSKLFEPFFTTKEVGVGSGLGLAISKNIIESYGGEISVESTLGQGTRFTIRLPVRAVEQEEAPRPKAAAQADQAPGRILIVDDEDGIRNAMVRMLRSHEVVQADSGAEARKLLETDRAFDLVLCDMMMPEVSGMDLHQWLLEAHPTLAERVIFITGGAFTPRTREYLNQVDNLRIEKPFDVANFRKIVNEFIKAGQGDKDR